jgi:hypothetical protein
MTLEKCAEESISKPVPAENQLPRARVLELKGGANPLAVLASYRQEFEKGFLDAAGEVAWREAATKLKAEHAGLRHTSDPSHQGSG